MTSYHILLVSHPHACVVTVLARLLVVQGSLDLQRLIQVRSSLSLYVRYSLTAPQLIGLSTSVYYNNNTNVYRTDNR